MILTYDEYYPDFKQTAPSDITFEGVKCQTIPQHDQLPTATIEEYLKIKERGFKQ